nr:metallophosphoesterase family protein [uncultured Tolumonas sp.]
MRIAILSDIHANIWALESVLNDANQQSVDAFINLGDILYGPLAPKATYDLLQIYPFYTIQGNQDRYIYEADNALIKANKTLKYIVSNLGNTPIKWLKNLPKTLEIDDLFLCHGCPDDDMAYLLEDISTGSPRLKRIDDIISIADQCSQSVILCGHTHIPRSIELPNGKLIINPGSVGLPAYTDDLPIYHHMATFSPMAKYCIITKIAPNRWCVENRQVAYPHQEAVFCAIKLERYDWANWLNSGQNDG